VTPFLARTDARAITKLVFLQVREARKRGEGVPSAVAIATALGTTRATVEHCLGVLERMGEIESDLRSR